MRATLLTPLLAPLRLSLLAGSLLGQCPNPCPSSCASPYCPYSMSGPVDFCSWPGSGCPPNYHAGNPQSGNEHPGCCCYDYSPILIDLDGGQFELTDAQRGVWFDITATKHSMKIAWTVRGSQQAWLALDRNGNGLIDDGGELFGNHTPQPLSTDPSGFRALAVYDTAINGGNGDGQISKADRVFSQLRLWRDLNHDGISQPEELLTLSQSGIIALSLNFVTSNRTDKFGNVFRYRARVIDTKDSNVGRYAWDVYLSVASPVSTKQMPGISGLAGGQ